MAETGGYWDGAPIHEVELVAYLLEHVGVFPHEAVAELQAIHFSDPVLGEVYDALRGIASNGVSADCSDAGPEVPSRLLLQALQRRGSLQRVGAARAVSLWDEGSLIGFESVLLDRVAQVRAEAAQRDLVRARDRGATGEEIKHLEAQVDSALSGTAAVSKLQTVHMEGIDVTKVDWLWEHYIPLGMVTMLDGPGAVGKSTIALDIVARLSRGGRMPDGSPGRAPGNSLIFSLEDPPAQVLKPRLLEARADCARVWSHGEPQRFADPETFVQVQALVREFDIKLMVLDPVMGFAGGADTYSDSNTRESLMTPLATLAEEFGIAIVCIRHFTKKSTDRASHRGGGSVAFSNASRSVLVCEEDPEGEKGDFVLASAKNNLSTHAPTLRYSIEGDDPTQPWTRIAWSGTSELSADEVVSAKGSASGSSQVSVPTSEIAAALRERLAGGVRASSTELQKEVGKQLGEDISKMTWSRAKKQAGVITTKSSFQGGWECYLED